MPQSHSPLSATIPYTLRINPRARHMRISVACDATVTLTVPTKFSLRAAEHFFTSKISWIEKTLERFKPYRPRISRPATRQEFITYRARALDLATTTLQRLNRFYGFSYQRVTIRNTKTRWGSCSRRGALSFNYKIVFLPPPLVEYLVAHELCHLKHFNHSKPFWEEVARAVPDYAARRRELRHTLI